MAADHNGVQMKDLLVNYINGLGHIVDDRGTNGTDIVDYPILCSDVGRRVVTGQADRGIIIGGSGQGEHIACNKIRGIRAGLCGSLFEVEISRGNNNSNVLVLAAKIISNELARQLTATWLTTPFKGGVHQHRLDQIALLEDGQELS
ncbi:MAG: RpiB/LacA/LacB family sugar-phosphate isomerase [Acidimicrobiaceae bacterium]|nr:RpiB/LacA/LacB family sugar-phosphate isomerase [Acidimicrobiaceae bacterium]